MSIPRISTSARGDRLPVSERDALVTVEEEGIVIAREKERREKGKVKTNRASPGRGKGHE
jgi:hypothetical protein